jgi:hypothetical protein
MPVVVLGSPWPGLIAQPESWAGSSDLRPTRTRPARLRPKSESGPGPQLRTIRAYNPPGSVFCILQLLPHSVSFSLPCPFCTPVQPPIAHLFLCHHSPLLPAACLFSSIPLRTPRVSPWCALPGVSLTGTSALPVISHHRPYTQSISSYTPYPHPIWIGVCTLCDSTKAAPFRQQE